MIFSYCQYCGGGGDGDGLSHDDHPVSCSEASFRSISSRRLWRSTWSLVPPKQSLSVILVSSPSFRPRKICGYPHPIKAEENVLFFCPLSFDDHDYKDEDDDDGARNGDAPSEGAEPPRSDPGTGVLKLVQASRRDARRSPLPPGRHHGTRSPEATRRDPERRDDAIVVDLLPRRRHRLPG